MRYVTIAVVGAILAVAAFSSSSAAEDQQPAATTNQPAPQAQKATVTKIVVKRPSKVKHMKRRFTLTLQPSPMYVRNVILPMEAARAGISAASLQNRASCESHFNWWASNGQYVGILQFGANAFYRGLSTIGTRRVELQITKFRRMHSRVYRYWSDGTISRHKGRVRRQRVVVRLVGYSSTRMMDPWTQARIAAQAIAGRSAVRSSEWACST